jgi:hypothetical protein
MYCSTCGVAVTKGLSYCNYCGAQLINAQDNSRDYQEVKPGLLVSAMVGVFILALPGIAVLIGVGKAGAGFDLPILIAIMILSFVILMIIEAVLIGLLFRQRKRPRDVSDSNRLKDHTTKELQQAHERMLHEPVPSVTENTTRAFEPIYSEPKSK